MGNYLSGFNPRARAGRDQHSKIHPSRSQRFNPRARAGRDNCQWLEVPPRRRFNPRARAGRDQANRRNNDINIVSIHAPARGATLCGLDEGCGKMFQSTRPRGARPDGKLHIVSDNKFQSTRPRGARRAILNLYNRHQDVSIHAPARGATHHKARPGKPWLFQSTRPRGARLFVASGEYPQMQFQSTRPRGARHSVSTILRCFWRFNPRARAGRDKTM